MKPTNPVFAVDLCVALENEKSEERTTTTDDHELNLQKLNEKVLRDTDVNNNDNNNENSNNENNNDDNNNNNSSNNDENNNCDNIDNNNNKDPEKRKSKKENAFSRQYYGKRNSEPSINRYSLTNGEKTEGGGDGGGVDTLAPKATEDRDFPFQRVSR